jgi:ParB family chromosome partitioning protein
MASGAPPEMPLERIVRDPDNPRPPLHLRTPDEQQKQAELNANIRQRGVKSPISLRPHPKLPDMWIINHGHCRYDGAQAAGFATIPYFVDPHFDSYDQVAENLHRCDLSIWAIAAFIKRKLDEGHSKAQIAERLGKESQNFVTEHLALVDAPICVHQAYANSVRSPRTLYDLRRAYDEFPVEVEAWCASGAKVTRDSIKELIDRLRHDVSSALATADSAAHVTPTRLTLTDTDEVSQDRPDVVLESGNRSTLRHDVMPVPPNDDQPSVPEIDHRVTPPAASPPPAAYAQTPHSATGKGIRVLYRGQQARLVSDISVKIIIEGNLETLNVPLAELVFDGST